MPNKLPKGPTLQLNLKYGKVLCRLFQDIAPNHVKRIIELVEEKSYDNVVFHRVIDGFMAQTGDVQYGNKLKQYSKDSICIEFQSNEVIVDCDTRDDYFLVEKRNFNNV